MKKQNCWEMKKCCKEVGNNTEINKMVCPASTETQFDGINNGKNAGRFCWNVKNTFCFGDNPDGEIGDKLLKCYECEFFRMVNEEESRGFVLFIEEKQTS